MLTEILGGYPQVKVIDLLITRPRIQYTKTEIADCAEIGRATLYKFWDVLERYQIVKPTYQIGKTILYTVNMDSPALKALKKFQLEMAEIEIALQNREELKEVEAEKTPAHG